MACINFEMALLPQRYRGDPEIAALNKAAFTTYAHLPSLVTDARSLAEDGIFGALRKGKRGYVLVTDAFDFLSKKHPKAEQSISGLILLYERVQRLRDRTLIIAAQAEENKSDIGVIWQRAESLLVRKYRELRLLKPADIRTVTLNEILHEIELRHAQVGSVLSICELVLKNCQTSHATLLEIQSILHTGGTLPVTSGKVSNGSYIPRRGDG